MRIKIIVITVISHKGLKSSMQTKQQQKTQTKQNKNLMCLTVCSLHGRKKNSYHMAKLSNIRDKHINHI